MPERGQASSNEGDSVETLCDPQRTLARATVAVIATVVLAAGCGSGSSSSSSSATTNVNPSEIPNGGTLNWPLTEPVSMTPIHGQEDQGA